MQVSSQVLNLQFDQAWQQRDAFYLVVKGWTVLECAIIIRVIHDGAFLPAAQPKLVAQPETLVHRDISEYPENTKTSRMIFIQVDKLLSM